MNSFCSALPTGRLFQTLIALVIRKPLLISNLNVCMANFYSFVLVPVLAIKSNSSFSSGVNPQDRFVERNLPPFTSYFASLNKLSPFSLLL